MPCVSPLKGWKDNETGGLTFDRTNTKEKMDVACGQCIGCRIDRRRHWSMRIVHESSLYEIDGGNCFITLTYRDRIECSPEQWRNGQHVPSDWSLHKAHFQKFMKRLRKSFEPQRIRYFVAGEYGRRCQHGIDLECVACPVCNLGRPHYHACLFNCSFPDLEPYSSGPNGLRYTSPMLEKIWGYGFVDVGELNFATAEYVAGYVLKKVTGIRADDHYFQYCEDGFPVWVTPEYCDMSRKPGLGRGWFDKYQDDVFPSDEVPVVGRGVLKGVPRYYQEIYAEEHPLDFEEVKRARQEFIKAHGYDFTPERLMDKYKVMRARQRLKVREL